MGVGSRKLLGPGQPLLRWRARLPNPSAPLSRAHRVRDSTEAPNRSHRSARGHIRATRSHRCGAATSASPAGRRSAMLCSPWQSDGSRPAPPGTCTSATCAPHSSPGCSPAHRASLPSADRGPRPGDLQPRSTSTASWTDLARSVWTSTATSCASPSASITRAASPALSPAGHLPVLLHPARDRRGGVGAARDELPAPTPAPAATDRCATDRHGGRPPPGAAAARRRVCGPRCTDLGRPVASPVDDFVLVGTTASRPTTSPWWSTTWRWASTRSCGATTCSPPRPGRPGSPASWAGPRRCTPTSPW